MKLNLKEARTLKAALAGEMEDLKSQRGQVAVVEIAPGEDFKDYINATVEELTEKIRLVREDYLRLDEMVRTENARIREVEGERISIAGLIAKNNEMRREQNVFRSLSLKKPKEIGAYSSKETILVTTYDIAAAKARAEELRAECDARSALIDRLDMEVTLDFERKS